MRGQVVGTQPDVDLADELLGLDHGADVNAAGSSIGNTSASPRWPSARSAAATARIV